MTTLPSDIIKEISTFVQPKYKCIRVQWMEIENYRDTGECGGFKVNQGIKTMILDFGECPHDRTYSGWEYMREFRKWNKSDTLFMKGIPEKFQNMILGIDNPTRDEDMGTYLQKWRGGVQENDECSACDKSICTDYFQWRIIERF